MNRLKKWAASIAPLAIIAGLLYAGLFIKPVAPATDLSTALISYRDAFYGIAVPEPRVLWAVGRDGKLLRSEDAGVQWAQQAIPSLVNLQSIAAWDAQHAVVVGNATTVLVTSDGGRQWRAASGLPSAGESQKLIRARIASPTQALVVGEFGAVFVTDDGGATWRAIGKSEDVAWHDIAALPERVLVAVGEFGRIQRSTDGGATWSAVPSPVKSTLTALRFRDADHGVAVGLEGAVLTTADGGRSWQPAASPTKEHLFDVAAGLPGGDAWLAVGDKGLLLRGSSEGRWSAARMEAGSYAWHTQIVPTEAGLYLAGAQLARLGPNGQMNRFR
jgi:photosystem II stability/assembly factor-like uncharacterized protein